MPRRARFPVLPILSALFLSTACDSAEPPVAASGLAAPVATAAPCDCPEAPDEVYEWATEPVDFKSAEKSVFATMGEDGVIAKAFEIIEPTTKFAVEFGAGNGIRASNTRRLIVEEGWSSLQIEGDRGRARELKANFADYPNVTALEAWVWPGNIEILFEENGVPKDFDLLVIDIDSNDYYVWRAIQSFRPKVVMIEVNPKFPPPQKMVIDFHPMNYWDHTDYMGASLQSYADLAKKKGYELIYHLSHGGNALFVDAKYFPLFGIRDNSAVALFNEPTEESVRAILPAAKEGREFLIWNKLRIKKKFLHHR